jgi:hypothetical protein
MRDELAHESFVVLKGDNALVLIAGGRLRELDALLYQPFYPETDGAREYRERGDGYLAPALSPSPRIGPGKESKDAPRISMFITEVEVIGCRIVKVYGALDEPEAEDAGVEIEIPLGIARDTGDVVNTGSAEAHRTDSCLASFRDFALIGACTRGSPFIPVAAFVLAGVGRDVFLVWVTGPCAQIAIALFRRGSGNLFLLSPGWHNTSSGYPSIKATDMPFAEALM